MNASIPPLFRNNHAEIVRDFESNASNWPRGQNISGSQVHGRPHDTFSSPATQSSMGVRVARGVGLAIAIPLSIAVDVARFPLRIIGALLGLAVGLPAGALMALTSLHRPSQIFNVWGNTIAGSIKSGKVICGLPLLPFQVLALMLAGCASVNLILSD